MPDAIHSTSKAVAKAANRSRSHPVGILAGGGALPLSVARTIEAGGGAVHIVGIHGEAMRDIEQFSHSWCYWGGIGAMLRQFKDAGCRELVIAGTVRRPDFKSIRPDIGLLKNIPLVWSLLRGGDDSVLSKVVQFFEAHEFTVRGAHEFAPDLLPPPGPLGAAQPTPAHLAAIRRGAHLLEALGPYDMGQAVLASSNRIIAVEGAGGTDAMIRSAMVAAVKSEAQAQTPGHFELSQAVLVKLPKPGQELRVDMPAIGPATVALANSAGLAGIAIAAGRCLVLQRDELLRQADDAQIFVTGIADANVGSARDGAVKILTPAQSPSTGAPGGMGFDQGNFQCQLVPLGRKKPNAGQWRDVELGCKLLAVLQDHEAGFGAMIARDYVLGVQGAGSLKDLIAQAQRSKPWGGLLPGRSGVLVLRQTSIARQMRRAKQQVPASLSDQDERAGQELAEENAVIAPRYEAIDQQLVAALAYGKFAGIAFCDGQVNAIRCADLVAAADEVGLFVVGAGAEP